MRYASLFLLVLGCGEVVPKNDAGGDGSGTADAAPDAPLIGEATVTLRLANMATAGRPVVFSNADGSIAGETTTDAMGVAKATVNSGAMVTIAINGNETLTITSIAPGDNIVVRTLPPFDNTSLGTVTFSSPAEATNKAYYRLDLGEDVYVTTQTMTSGMRSLDYTKHNLDATSKIHAVVGVYDATDKLISYQFQSNLTPVPNGTFNVSTSNFRTDLGNVTVTLSGAPAESTLLGVESANEHNGMLFMPSGFAGLDRSSVTNGSAAVIVPYLGGFGDFVQTSAALTVSTTERFQWSRRVARPAGDFVIGTADMPPRIAAPMLDKSDPTRPVAMWTFNGNAAAGDATLVQLQWKDAGGGTFTWYAFGPPDATSIKFPVVPSAFAAQAPVQTSIYQSIDISHHDLTPLNGYAAFRVAPAVDFDNPFVLLRGFNRWVRSNKRAMMP